MYKLTVGFYKKKDAYYVFKDGKRATWGLYTTEMDVTSRIRSAIQKRDQKDVTIDIKEKRIEDKPLVYRSVKAIGYKLRSDLEYRVWIHTNNPDISEDELDQKLNEAIQKYPPANKKLLDSLQELAGTEINREIDKDEIQPSHAGFYEWFYEIKIEWESGKTHSESGRL